MVAVWREATWQGQSCLITQETWNDVASEAAAPRRGRRKCPRCPPVTTGDWFPLLVQRLQRCSSGFPWQGSKEHHPCPLFHPAIPAHHVKLHFGAIPMQGSAKSLCERQAASSPSLPALPAWCSWHLPPMIMIGLPLAKSASQKPLNIIT